MTPVQIRGDDNAIFLNPGTNVPNSEVLAANVSDGGQDCRSHNNNNRLDTRSIQNWINDTIEQRNRPKSGAGATVSTPPLTATTLATCGSAWVHWHRLEVAVRKVLT